MVTWVQTTVMPASQDSPGSNCALCAGYVCARMYTHAVCSVCVCAHANQCEFFMGMHTLIYAVSFRCAHVCTLCELCVHMHTLCEFCT